MKRLVGVGLIAISYISIEVQAKVGVPEAPQYLFDDLHLNEKVKDADGLFVVNNPEILVTIGRMLLHPGIHAQGSLVQEMSEFYLVGQLNNQRVIDMVHLVYANSADLNDFSYVQVAREWLFAYQYQPPIYVPTVVKEVALLAREKVKKDFAVPRDVTKIVHTLELREGYNE